MKILSFFNSIIIRLLFVIILLFAVSVNATTVAVDKDFMEKVKTVFANPIIATSMKQKSGNYLVGKIDQGHLCFLSGIQPILTTENKATFQKETNLAAVDMLSILLTEEQQNFILDYCKLTRVNNLLDKWFSGGGIFKSSTAFKKKNIGQTTIKSWKLALANLIEYYKKLSDIPVDIKNLEIALNGDITFEKIKEPLEKAKAIISNSLNKLRENAINAATTYFSNLATYANKFVAIIDGIKDGLDVFDNMTDNDKLAYIVDATIVKLPEDTGQKIYPIIQLSHTEPIYIEENKKKGVAYFFSYKDMCKNCSNLVQTATENGLLPQKFVVLSQQSLENKNVDFSYDTTLPSQLTHNGNLLKNVFQMRIKDINTFDNNTEISINFLG